MKMADKTNLCSALCSRRRVRVRPTQANRWWLHLYRLLIGEWTEDLQASNPLQPQLQSDSSATAEAATGKRFEAPDWPSARSYFPDWLWSGLASGGSANKRNTQGGTVDAGSGSPGGWEAASLAHARGELDDGRKALKIVGAIFRIRGHRLDNGDGEKAEAEVVLQLHRVQ